jgi:hypothetical protein
VVTESVVTVVLVERVVDSAVDEADVGVAGAVVGVDETTVTGR